MKFNYRPYLTLDSSGRTTLVYRPVISIRLAGRGKGCRWDALVDTGADECIFPASVARLLGLDLRSAEGGRITGVGGAALDCAYAELTLELATEQEKLRWRARAGFIDYDRAEDESLILGHAEFLEFFTATFDGAGRALELIANVTLPSLGE